MRHITPLIATTGLLIGGAYTYAAEETVTGIALLAAGLVTLGVWVAIQVRDEHPDERKDNTDG